MAVALAAPVIAFLLGYGGPAALDGIFGPAVEADAVAARIWAYAPQACALTDKAIDATGDAIDVRLGNRITIWRRLGDSVVAAADSLCAHANEPNTTATRLSAMVAAIVAVAKVNTALDAAKK